MKIVHVIDRVDGERLYQEGYLAIEQARSGHLTKIVAREVAGNPATLAEAGADIELVASRWSRLQRLRQLHAVMRTSPDVVHVHNFNTAFSLIAVASARRLGVPVLADSHVSDENATGSRFTVGAKKRIFRWTIAPVLKRAVQRFIAVAGPEQRFLSQMLGVRESSITLVPLGADTDLFRPRSAAERRRAREALGVSDDEFCLTHIGRLTAQKGIPVACRMAKRAGCRLVLIGDADEEVRPLLDAPNVTWLPGVDKMSLATLISACDLGVWAGKPSVSLLEVLAVGVPVVTFDLPHYREVLGESGLFARSEDELIAHIIRLRDDPDVRKRVATAQRQRITASRSWAVIARRFEQEYREAMRSLVSK